MAIPQALFAFVNTTTNRTVKFTDGSIGIPASWAWDFGDSQNSTEENPEHIFADDGVYKIKLTATNTDGSNILQYEIVVSDAYPSSPSIYQMIMDNKPDGITVHPMSLFQDIKNYLIIMQDAAHVSDADVFKQEKYPVLMRYLIAQVIVFEKVIDAARGGLLSVATGTGGIKSIEAGPAKTEWYDVSSLIKNSSSSGGSLNLLQANICETAAAVGVYLGMCPRMNIVVPPRVFREYCNPCQKPPTLFY